MAFVTGSSRNVRSGPMSRGEKWGYGLFFVAAAAVIAGLFSYESVTASAARERRQSPNFPQLDLAKNLNEVQRPDGRVERIIKTQEGREYVLRGCDSRFDPKPEDIDGPYNPDSIKVFCVYDLGGERSYMGALKYADKIYAKEIKEREGK